MQAKKHEGSKITKKEQVLGIWGDFAQGKEQRQRRQEAGKGKTGIVSRKLEGKMMELVRLRRNFLKIIED